MTLSLAGKTALVTGATRGLGLETARQLGALGATVIISGRDVKKVDATVQELINEGYDAEGIRLDVTSDEDRVAARDYVEREHKALDILINNAAVWLESTDASNPPENQASTLPMEVLYATFEANFFGPIRLTQLLLPLIRKARHGRIVNVTSILGSLTLHSDPTSVVYSNKIFAYDASKTVLNAFTVHLAHELRDTSIKVNSIHPGWVRSDMGGSAADLDLVEGSRTSVNLATIPADGPTGGFFFMDDALPW